jgi:hypothetical protein
LNFPSLNKESAVGFNPVQQLTFIIFIFTELSLLIYRKKFLTKRAFTVLLLRFKAVAFGETGVGST